MVAETSTVLCTLDDHWATCLHQPNLNSDLSRDRIDLWEKTSLHRIYKGTCPFQTRYLKYNVEVCAMRTFGKNNLIRKLGEYSISMISLIELEISVKCLNDTFRCYKRLVFKTEKKNRRDVMNFYSRALSLTVITIHRADTSPCDLSMLSLY